MRTYGTCRWPSAWTLDDITSINRFYLLLGFTHFINSVQFLLSWVFPLCDDDDDSDKLQLNIVGDREDDSTTILVSITDVDRAGAGAGCTREADGPAGRGNDASFSLEAESASSPSPPTAAVAATVQPTSASVSPHIGYAVRRRPSVVSVTGGAVIDTAPDHDAVSGCDTSSSDASNGSGDVTGLESCSPVPVAAVNAHAEHAPSLTARSPSAATAFPVACAPTGSSTPLVSCTMAMEPWPEPSVSITVPAPPSTSLSTTALAASQRQQLAANRKPHAQQVQAQPSWWFCSAVTIPEWLNILGASLYLASASMYHMMDTGIDGLQAEAGIEHVCGGTPALAAAGPVNGTATGSSLTIDAYDALSSMCPDISAAGCMRIRDSLNDGDAGVGRRILESVVAAVAETASAATATLVGANATGTDSNSNADSCVSKFSTSSSLGNDGIAPYTDPWSLRVHNIEVTAAGIEVLAAIGWFVTWRMTFDRRAKGRGWSVFDLDLWANAFTLVPSLVYAAFAGRVWHSPERAQWDTLYEAGDVLYAMGAAFYLLAALRDEGWFEWFPWPR